MRRIMIIRFLLLLLLLPLTIPPPIAQAQVRRTPTPQEEIVIHTATPADDGSIIHRVRAGETLWTIAMAYGVSVDELVALNNLRAADPVIYSGQNLVIRPAHTPTPTVTATGTPSPSPTATATRRPTRTPRPTETPTPGAIEQQVTNFALDNRIFIAAIVLAVGALLFLVVTFGIKDRKRP
jgi:LysM repeat protein